MVEEIVVDITKSGLPGASGLVRKRKALKMALYREQKKIKGHPTANITNVEDIKTGLPMSYQVLSFSLPQILDFFAWH